MHTRLLHGIIFVMANLCLILRSAMAGELVFREPSSDRPVAAMGNMIPSASFLGMMDYERIGYYMGNAGDVNGDGCEDFLIGTFHNRENGYDAGATYLILGNLSNIWGYKKQLNQADARFLGKDDYDAFGFYVSGNGDVNGDGYDDFLIGAPAGNESGGPKPGHAFLFLGRPNCDWGYDCIARDRADASFVGRHGYDHAGEAVAMIGDINRDGYDDFIIGAPFNDDGGSNAGKVYLFLGKPSGWYRNIDIEKADASFIGVRDEGWAGYVVSAAGDVNGDSIPDFLIGSFHQDNVGGRIYLIFGRKNRDWGFNFSLDNANVIFEGEKSYDKAGWSLACAGDVNNDGLSDILIGACDNDDGGQQAGKVYLILGKASGWLPRLNLRWADASWQGEHSDDQASWSAAGVPDVNHDHYDEIMIGAWHNNQSGTYAGKAYLIYGKASGWSKNVNLHDIPDYFLGEYNGDYAGYCVAGNDANGDGLGDIWISASYNSDYRYRSGKVYSFLSEKNFAEISGQITYYDNGNPLPLTAIYLNHELCDSTVTNAKGGYAIQLPCDSDYVLSPSKPKDASLNSDNIIAYDAALALQAAIEKVQLDSFQRKAADANQDSIVSAYDAALIARYVVGYADSDSYVGEWRFQPAQRSYLHLREDFDHQDFSAMIIGNIHGNWRNPDSATTPIHLAKNALSLIKMEGNQFRIPISVNHGRNIFSLELALSYPPDQFSLVQIQKSNLVNSFQLVSNQHAGGMSLALYGAQPITEVGEIANLIFKANEPVEFAKEIIVEKFRINDDAATTGILSFDDATNSSAPKEFEIYQNYPNPFNHRTAIRFSLNNNCYVSLAIFNLQGELVKTIVDRPMSPQEYIFEWDGTDDSNRTVAAGVYVCQIFHEKKKESFKLLFIK